MNRPLFTLRWGFPLLLWALSRLALATPNESRTTLFTLFPEIRQSCEAVVTEPAACRDVHLYWGEMHDRLPPAWRIERSQILLTLLLVEGALDAVRSRPSHTEADVAYMTTLAREGEALSAAPIAIFGRKKEDFSRLRLTHEYGHFLFEFQRKAISSKELPIEGTPVMTVERMVKSRSDERRLGTVRGRLEAFGIHILAPFGETDRQYYADPSEEFAHRFAVRSFRQANPEGTLSDFLNQTQLTPAIERLLASVRREIPEAEVADLAPLAVWRYFEVLGGWEETP
jgi:hypothetical protein